MSQSASRLWTTSESSIPDLRTFIFMHYDVIYCLFSYIFRESSQFSHETRLFLHEGLLSSREEIGCTISSGAVRRIFVWDVPISRVKNEIFHAMVDHFSREDIFSRMRGSSLT